MAIGSVPSAVGRVRIVVLVSHLGPVSLRALGWARAIDAASVEAVTVQVDADETDSLIEAWGQRRLDTPLTALDGSRGLVEPVVDHVACRQREHPQDVFSIFIPQYVIGRRFERILHHRRARQLRAGLLSMERVMVTAVSWPLPSALARR